MPTKPFSAADIPHVGHARVTAVVNPADRVCSFPALDLRIAVPAAMAASSPPIPSSLTAVAAPIQSQARPEDDWAWASEDLKQRIHEAFCTEACLAAPSPARIFGASLGALGLGDKLGLNPHREIEKLKARVDGLETRHTSKGGRRNKPGTVSAAGRRRSPKKADITLASRRLRQLQKDVVDEVKATAKHTSEEEVRRELLDKIFRHNRQVLTTILHERYGYPLGGDKTLSRTPEFISWKRYRLRGNARRLDPDNPSVSGTAGGGKSAGSGRSREKQYADANNLSVTRFGKLRGFDAEAEKRIAEDPKSRRWLEENGSVLEEPTDSGEDVDNH